MPDFQRILYRCEKSSYISDRLVDRFLIPLCAAEEGLEKKFAQQLSEYRHIVNKMPSGWPGWLISQDIAFQLFRENGLARNYLEHSQVRRRSDREQDYLKFQIDHPWRFVFCSVIQRLRDSFLEMTDVLTGEKFLLYSPGIEAQEKQGSISMYFLLVGFNGSCWQTYGTIAYLKGIQPFDLDYYAKQVKPDLVSKDQIPELIDQNPLPFMMLWSGGEFPVAFHKDDMVVVARSEFQLDNFTPQDYAKHFVMQEKNSVYRLSLKRWHEFPHYCRCYYSVETKQLTVNAMTKRGYLKLISVLNEYGMKFSDNPQILVTMAMLMTAKEILQRDMEADPYEKLFAVKPAPGADREMERLNQFVGLLMEHINAGREYDIRKLAAQAGIDYENARRIAEQIGEKMVKARNASIVPSDK